MVGAGERVLGYTGACGLVQAMAVGYFVWDLIVSTLHIGDFGIGLFLHAVSALAVYMLGFVSCIFSFLFGVTRGYRACSFVLGRSRFSCL